MEDCKTKMSIYGNLERNTIRKAIEAAIVDNNNEEIIREGAKPISNSDKLILIADGIFFGAIILKGFSAWRKAKKEEAAKKKYKESPEYKELIKQENEFGDILGKKVEEYLKDYIKKNNYDKLYKDSIYSYKRCLCIEYDPILNYDVRISDYQDGIDYDAYINLKKKDESIDINKDPRFDNEWYTDLLDEGEKCTKSIFNTLENHNNFYLEVSTGDGDEGYIYINVVHKDKK